MPPFAPRVSQKFTKLTAALEQAGALSLKEPVRHLNQRLTASHGPALLSYRLWLAAFSDFGLWDTTCLAAFDRSFLSTLALTLVPLSSFGAGEAASAKLQNASTALLAILTSAVRASERLTILLTVAVIVALLLLLGLVGSML